MNRGVTSANNTIRQPTTGPSSGGAYPTASSGADDSSRLSRSARMTNPARAMIANVNHWMA